MEFKRPQAQLCTETHAHRMFLQLYPISTLGMLKNFVSTELKPELSFLRIRSICHFCFHIKKKHRCNTDNKKLIKWNFLIKKEHKLIQEPCHLGDLMLSASSQAKLLNYYFPDTNKILKCQETTLDIF